MLTLFGLGFIAVAWIIQLFFATQKNVRIHSAFIGLYVTGAVLLVVDGYIAGAYIEAAINFIALVAALLVLFKLYVKPGEAIEKPNVHKKQKDTDRRKRYAHRPDDDDAPHAAA